MIDIAFFYQLLRKRGIDFFCGVPDSLLKEFCAYVTDQTDSSSHIITANEGNAVGLAAGYHLATGKIGLVYMQNSGMGNAINPLVSLMDPEVYNIPALILIGWRGEPGFKDEPQHQKQGKITLPLLDTLSIPYKLLPDENVSAEESLTISIASAKQHGSPVAIVIKRDTFSPYKPQLKEDEYHLTRETAITTIADSLSPMDILVSTTGKASRELFEFRKKDKGKNLGKDFLTVGSMGHTSQIALGIAISKPSKQVYCLDGDGSLIMHMGGMAIVGNADVSNFKHIILNNGAHDSVGGQPTMGFDIDIPKIAEACGYKRVFSVNDVEKLKSKVMELQSCVGPALLEVKIRKGARSDLGRPSLSPIENKQRFMEHVEG
jgi:phosphonopyruvate decarboxylase